MGDLVDHLHAAYDLGEYRIAEVAAAVVEEIVVAMVDEELAGRRIHVLRTSHGDGAAHVVQAIVRFVLDRGLGGLLVQAFAEAAALDHEAGNDAVEHGAVIKAAVDVAEEVLDADRCLFRFELELDLAQAGGQQYARVFRGEQVAGQQNGTGGEGNAFQHDVFPDVGEAVSRPVGWPGQHRTS